MRPETGKKCKLGRGFSSFCCMAERGGLKNGILAWYNAQKQGGVGVAKKQLSTRKKNQIIADYVRTESYSATARSHGVSPNTVKRLVATRPEVAEMCEAKKRADAREVTQYMEEQKKLACQIIGNGLQELAKPEKLKGASPRDIATTIAIVIDKWTGMGGKKDADVRITFDGGDEAWRK